MNKIILTFLTDQGTQAYHRADEAGKNESWKNKRITEKVCTDKIINKNPLTVEVDIKIGWLAVQVELDKQIKKGLAKFDAIQDRDYTIEVI